MSDKPENQTPRKIEPVKLLNYDENRVTFMDKARQNPLFPIGITGLVGIAGYKLMSTFRNRNKKNGLPISLQIIETRVMAQGFVLATLSAGIVYVLSKRIYALATNQKFKDPFISAKKE